MLLETVNNDDYNDFMLFVRGQNRTHTTPKSDNRLDPYKKQGDSHE